VLLPPALLCPHSYSCLGGPSCPVHPQFRAILPPRHTCFRSLWPSLTPADSRCSPYLCPFHVTCFTPSLTVGDGALIHYMFLSLA
jgi:hypothetical protein